MCQGSLPIRILCGNLGEILNIMNQNHNRMTNKRFFRNTLGAVVATLSLGIFTETTASADEGMWLPSLIAERIGDMQSKGFKLPPRTSTA